MSLLRTALLAPIVFAFQTVDLATASAQSRQSLLPPSDSIGEPFSHVGSLRELSSGRLLVADFKESRLRLTDFDAGRVQDVGRVGSGPDEYPAVRPLFARGDDSTLMIDRTARRWLLLHRDSILGLVSTADRAFAATKGNVLFANARGEYLSTVGRPLGSPVRPGAGELWRDTLDLALYSFLRTERIDTVSTLLSAPRRTSAGEVASDGRPRSIRFDFPVLRVGEQVLLTRDGWIAIARLDPYRIDWRRPDGRWVAGAVIELVHVPIDRREREFVRARAERAGGRSGEPRDDALWPSALPPFENSPMLEAPDGTVLVARLPSARAPERRYDHVDRAGRRLRQFVMAENRRIVGFGRDAVYTVRVDDDGLEWLFKHPWKR